MIISMHIIIQYDNKDVNALIFTILKIGT